MTEARDRETVLYAFAVETAHDRETLERYLSRYPELAEELIDLMSELRLGQALGSSETGADADANWEAAWQEFRACGTEAMTAKAVVPAFDFPKGEAFVRLAEALNAPRSILAALRDGLVAAVSIPERFVERFAQAADASVVSVKEYFQNPQPTFVARAFKSTEKPSHQGQATFRELVENTEMSDEQRQLLLEELKDNGLD